MTQSREKSLWIKLKFLQRWKQTQLTGQQWYDDHHTSTTSCLDMILSQPSLKDTLCMYRQWTSAHTRQCSEARHNYKHVYQQSKATALWQMTRWSNCHSTALLMSFLKFKNRFAQGSRQMLHYSPWQHINISENAHTDTHTRTIRWTK